MSRIGLTLMAFVMSAAASFARENIGKPPGGGKLSTSPKLHAGDCAPATSSIDLDINNIRARIHNGGDMWWDLVNNAKYEVPKSLPGQPENPSSLFAGAVWIGGIDAQNQLKVAAATYRQSGNDYFPGPLDENGVIDATICNLWDKHFEVLGSEIDSFLQLFEATGGNISPNQIPKGVLNWPAYGNPYFPQVGNRNMAPFEDYDGNGYYDPTGGDYPVIDETCQKKTYADQMIWWVYNDNGNIHTETGAINIGMEIQALAFAFKTNDEVNDMTFYKYRLYNKATIPLDSCFMGQWVDPDLGCYTDDYIGCDIETGLGIVYNANAVDAQSCALNYGNQPPYLGVDYFQGPFDENGVRLGLSSFLYYNNDFSQIGNPEDASDYYGYLSGTWKDGTPFTYGGNAYGGTVKTNYVFPDDPSDPNGWSECAANNPPADRRTMQNSGPFRLDPGASNEIVVGVVWVRPPIGTYPCPPYKLLKQADEKAQALFDNCFQLKDGPPAPDLEIVELDRELIISIVNTKDIENFSIADPAIKALNSPDSLYRFEGYKLYQLVNGDVSVQDYDDPSKARLIFQCDVKNGVGKIVNYVYDVNLDVPGQDQVPNVPVLMVDGADQGISHTVRVINDAFATGDPRLINNKTYYFSIVSYAYNYFKVNDTIFDDEGNIISITSVFQNQPYLEGRKNIKIYSAIPHLTAPESGGLVLNASYGDGPVITRLEGAGHGRLVVDLTPESVQDILNSPNHRSYRLTYQGGKGPVNIKVYNPKVVPNATFELALVDANPIGANKLLNAATTRWYIKNLNTGEVVYSDTTINYGNEQLIPDWGLSVYILQSRNPGNTNTVPGDETFGYLESSLTYADPQKMWLSGVQDQDGETPLNWIRAGSSNAPNSEYPDYIGIDPNKHFANIINGTWAPYRLAANDATKPLSPAWNDVSHTSSTLNPLDSLISIDLVFTPDRSKWSRCVVIELQNEAVLAEGGKKKFDLRAGQSRDIDGNPIAGETGMSWFPGYAINPETGERLNVFFGEDSWLVSQNGRDMWWNPTSGLFSPVFEIWAGGKHFVYVSRTRYDGCANFYNLLKTGATTDRRNVMKTICWVGIPMLASGYEFLPISEGFIPTETTLRIRVAKPYKQYFTDDVTNNGMPRYQFSTANLAAVRGDLPTAQSALDLIRVVPNPYYAYSAYEVSQVDNRVKITNLPPKCTITIYALNGTQVRRFERDDPTITSLDWDLKNDAGIPIASGLYIIHINAPGIGEKTLKWFGVLRPTDLTNY
ncbi:MAG: hypothetical protein NZL95_05575 [Chitinophagales bacterium]|nr:hypothetical protein [Chitinophagales bacterium]MDW8428003.1 hypothetical protein [Chitinophagales bacterium]